ncbi:hypothetical protein BaRGS_00011484 [Batillaria attramentaria]|uniref:Uncharacterized protein n=1 Tax=Batillaria attramentaria TaxID=370345 RepID=A0ABD0LCT7_9CAEN
MFSRLAEALAMCDASIPLNVSRVIDFDGCVGATEDCNLDRVSWFSCQTISPKNPNQRPLFQNTTEGGTTVYYGEYLINPRLPQAI